MLTAPTFQQVLLGGGVLLLLAGNCGKGGLGNGPDPNATLLTRAPWRLVGYTTRDNATPPRVTNVYATLPAYRRDDVYSFDPDNTLVFDEGPLKEHATDPQLVSGAWQFQAYQTGLSIALFRDVPLGSAGSTTPTIYTLRRLDADTLRLSSGTAPAESVITLAH